MGQCRYCSASGWKLRTNRHGVCKSCSELIQTMADCNLTTIKAALALVRTARDPAAQDSHCATALKAAEELLAFEKRALCEVRPHPSSVIEMLHAKRADLREKSRCANTPTQTRDSGLARSAPVGESKMVPIPVASMPEQNVSEGEGTGGNPIPDHQGWLTDDDPQNQWWAWGRNQSTMLCRESSSEKDRRGVDRTAVDCYALLNPGGILGQLENLSAGGLFLRAGETRPVGSKVRLIVSTGSGPIAAWGVVRWIRDAAANDPGPTGRGMGIEFTEISAELSQHLRSYLNFVVASQETAAKPIAV